MLKFFCDNPTCPLHLPVLDPYDMPTGVNPKFLLQEFGVEEVEKHVSMGNDYYGAGKHRAVFKIGQWTFRKKWADTASKKMYFMSEGVEISGMFCSACVTLLEMVGATAEPAPVQPPKELEINWDNAQSAPPKNSNTKHLNPIMMGQVIQLDANGNPLQKGQMTLDAIPASVMENAESFSIGCFCQDCAETRVKFFQAYPDAKLQDYESDTMVYFDSDTKLWCADDVTAKNKPKGDSGPVNAFSDAEVQEMILSKAGSFAMNYGMGAKKFKDLADLTDVMGIGGGSSKMAKYVEDLEKAAKDKTYAEKIKEEKQKAAAKMTYSGPNGVAADTDSLFAKFKATMEAAANKPPIVVMDSVMHELPSKDLDDAVMAFKQVADAMKVAKAYGMKDLEPVSKKGGDGSAYIMHANMPLGVEDYELSGYAKTGPNDGQKGPKPKSQNLPKYQSSKAPKKGK